MEWLVAVLAVVGIGAVLYRFLPRDAAGRARLPRIIDDSVGMYVVRKALGRPTWTDDAVDAPADPIGDEDTIAWRIGMPGAPVPTSPTRFIVSEAPPQAHPIGTPVPRTPIRPGPSTRRDRRPASALAAQRRIAAIATLGLVAIVVAAVTVLPGTFRGEVLTATGTPGPVQGTPGPSLIAVIPTPPGEPITPSPATVSPSASASAEPSPTVPIVTSAPTPLPATPRITPRPTDTPRPPTPTPTVAATPTPTPAPTPTPTPVPTPTPTPVPVPEAWIDTSPSPPCGAGPLLVQFDGSSSVAAATFSWNFGDGATSTAVAPSHEFSASSLVTLTVTNASGSDTAQVAVTVGSC